MTSYANLRQSQDETYKCRDRAKTETRETMSRDSLETRHVSRDSITAYNTLPHNQYYKYLFLIVCVNFC